MMHLQQAIFRCWGADHRLCALVPAERVLSGAPLNNPPMPYVVLKIGERRAVARTSSGTVVDRVKVRFEAWSPRLEDVQAVAEQLVRRFERASFETAAGRVLDMRGGAGQEQLHTSGLWQQTLSFELLVLVDRR